jgi:hypothetical protein
VSWLKDAVERRLVNLIPKSPEPVKLAVGGRLFFGKSQFGNKFEAQNFAIRKKIVDSGARWDVHSELVEWERIHLDLDFSANDLSTGFDDLAVVFSAEILCKSTRFRQAITIPREQMSASIVLERSKLRGDVIVTPFIVNAGGSGSMHDWRSMKAARIASGFPIHIRIDAAIKRPGAGIDVHWYDFEDAVRDSLYQLTIEPPDVLLRINSRHPALKGVFQDQSKTGNRAKIRNALFSLIASDVWYQLAEYACSVERQDLDDLEDPSVQLSKQLLKTISRMLKLRAEQIMDSFADMEGRSAIHVRLQHHLKAAVHQNTLITGLMPEEEESPEMM